MKQCSRAIPLTLALGILWLAVIDCSAATSLPQTRHAGAARVRQSLSSTQCRTIHSACKGCKVSEVGRQGLNSQRTTIKSQLEAQFLVCTSCDNGWRLGAKSETPCVALRTASVSNTAVRPGWHIDPATNKLVPCDKGYYGPGATSDDLSGSCQKCPDGYTTLENAAISEEDCRECLPGHGDPGCSKCPYGTYSYGGQEAGCEACPPGTTSAQGAGSAEECVASFPLRQAATAVWIPVSDTRLLRELGPGGTESEAACESLCGRTTNCILYQFRYVAPQQCLGLLQVSGSSGGSRVAVGVKGYSAGTVADYAFYYLPSGVTLGDELRNVGSGKTLKQCTDACTALDECVVVRVTGKAGIYSCRLFGGVLDAEYSSGYQVLPQNLLQDGVLVTTA